MRSLITGLLALLFVLPVLASGPGAEAARRQAESSMLVTGHVDIEPDGSVSDYAIDKSDKVPEGVIALVDRYAPKWKFDPVLVDGKAVRARANMSLRIVAREVDNDSFAIEIRGASFGQDEPGTGVASKRMPPPRYPSEAVRSGVAGTVYLVLKIGRDGRVADAIVEQVNLKVIDDEATMARWRDTFAKATVKVAKSWTFKPPVTGDAVDDEYWLIRVPVDYSLGTGKPGYGKWTAYVPGPRQVVPWPGQDEATLASSADTVPADGVQQLGRQLRLLTPLGQE